MLPAHVVVGTVVAALEYRLEQFDSVGVSHAVHVLADRKSLVLQFVNHHKFPLLDHVRAPWRIFVNPTIEAIFFGFDFLPVNGQKVNPSLTVTGYFQSELLGYLNRN